MIGPLSSQLNAIKWGEFKLGDLFEVLSSKKIYHANTIKIHDTQIENSYPYVVRAATNNGIKGFIVDDPHYTNEKILFRSHKTLPPCSIKNNLILQAIGLKF